MPKKAPKSIDFERSLQELNQLVEKMERGDLSLEESLKTYEKGIHLIRECQQAVTQAQQKIEILTRDNQQEVLKPFEYEPDKDD